MLTFGLEAELEVELQRERQAHMETRARLEELQYLRGYLAGCLGLGADAPLEDLKAALATATRELRELRGAARG